MPQERLQQPLLLRKSFDAFEKPMEPLQALRLLRQWLERCWLQLELVLLHLQRPGSLIVLGSCQGLAQLPWALACQQAQGELPSSAAAAAAHRRYRQE